jgi:hypothetical protein
MGILSLACWGPRVEGSGYVDGELHQRREA